MPRLNTNVRLEEACERYVTRITNEGQSETSVRTAQYALKRLRISVAGRNRRDPNPWLHLITPQVMDDYCYGANGIRQGIQSDSFNRYRSVLNNLFEYGIAMRWCDTNPMRAIGRARPDAPKPRLLLNAGELIALLDACVTPVQRIGCSIGMNTGLRANDVRRLRIFDVQLASGVIQTEIRKTRKLDVKPITLDLRPELIRWMDEYAELMGLENRSGLDDEWLLVPSYDILPHRTGGPRPITLHPTRLFAKTHLLVQNPLGRLGYPTKGEGFHTLRRSSARALFESLRQSGEGRDHALMIVRDYLNHASTAQTEHYLGLSHERALRDALLKDQPFLSRLAQTEQERVSGETLRSIGVSQVV